MKFVKPTIKKHKENPIQLETRVALVKWLHNIHNLVNIKNGKEEFSYEDFIEKYTNLYSGK